MMVKHKHAEVIHAWADGAEIEYRGKDGEQWMRTGIPEWSDHTQYRVKPAKVYPVTGMMRQDLADIYHSSEMTGPLSAHQIAIANAALRHAIDAGQVVSMDDHIAAVLVAGMQGKKLGRENGARRDMAIARNVLSEVHRILTHRGIVQDIAIDLAATIATVKD